MRISATIAACRHYASKPWADYVVKLLPKSTLPCRLVRAGGQGRHAHKVEYGTSCAANNAIPAVHQRERKGQPGCNLISHANRAKGGPRQRTRLLLSKARPVGRHRHLETSVKFKDDHAATFSDIPLVIS
jgi:hypothetical protein